MKLQFLNYRTRSALKKNTGLRANVPFKSANQVGIVFTVEDRQKHDDIKDFIHRLEQEGKQVQVLEFLPRKKENYEFLFDYFSMDDLNFWGKIRNTKALKFIETPFDYLYCVDTVHNPLILYLLATCRAHCRIGKFSEPSRAYFEMMIENNGSTKGLIDNMFKYSRQLR